MKNRALLTALVSGALALSCFAQKGPERLRITPLDGDGNGVPISLNQPDQQFKAFLSFFSGEGLSGGEQDITGKVTWSVSPSNIATMGVPPGAIHPRSIGTATVTAISGPNQVSTKIVVVSGALQSIAISPLTPSVPKGLARQFTASGDYGT